MLTAENITFGYGEEPVLRDLSVKVRDGAVTTLLGANGCGKTTLLNLLTKNLRPDKGRITVDGADIGSFSLKQFARLAAIVHQKNTAPDDLTVERLVSYGRLPYTSVFRLSLDEENRKQVERALSLTDLSELRDRPIGTLSGGQRQRAFIAMALAQNTKLLFLDEPTTFLDVRYQVEILQLVRKLNREQGMTIVMVLHDINQALSYSDEIIGLKNGRLAFQGPPEEVVTTESIRDLYGIELPVIRAEGRLLVPAVAGHEAQRTKGVPVETVKRTEETKRETAEDRKTHRSKTVRAVFAVLGAICLALGAVGVALPILPTTPFLIVAAFCFARSSEKLDKWFKGTRLYKSHLETLNRGEGMTWPAKLRIMGTVTAVMAIAEFFMIRAHMVKGSQGALYGCIVMGIVWLCHIIAFCFIIKTCPKERAEEIAEERQKEEADAHDAQ